MKRFFITGKAGVIVSLFTAVLSFYSCSHKSIQVVQQIDETARYSTGFPGKNTSTDLERVMFSVKKIKNYSSYRTYIFDDNSRITIKDLNSDGLLEHTTAGIVTNDATSGTATVIFSDGKHIALLTCNHAVKAPDTLFQWAEYSDLNNNHYIHSVSIKIKQQLYISGLPAGSKFEVLASDTKNDIAIIGTSFTDPLNDVQPLAYPCGKSSDLKWGSFIYIAGYPTGQQMVTHGIVSTLPEKSGSFLTDAPFNEGFSGGIAIAVTDIGGRFEMVGMARSVTASYGYVLKPEKENHEFTYNPDLPYTGKIFVNQKKDLNYGVTSVISIDQIRLFYSENRTNLIAKGFDLDEFFGLEPQAE